MIYETENQASPSWQSHEGSLGNFSRSFPSNSFPFWMAKLKELCEIVWKPRFYLGSSQTTASVRKIRKAWWSAIPNEHRWLKARGEAWECALLSSFPGNADDPGPVATLWELLPSSTHLLNISKTRVTYILLLCN